jgi:E3 ubiquitin-protein ligase TRIP12
MSVLVSFQVRWNYFQQTSFGSLTTHHVHLIDPSVIYIPERGSP